MQFSTLIFKSLKLKTSLLRVSLFTLLCIFHLNSAVALDFVQPADIIGDGYKIRISDLGSLKDISTFKVTFFNTSNDQFLSVNPHKLGIEYKDEGSAEGVYYFNSKMSKISNQNFVVLPGEDKSKVIKVMGDFDHRSERINIHIDGLKQGTMPSESLAIESLTLNEGDKEAKILTDLVMEIEKVSSKGGFSAKIKVEFPEYAKDNYLIAFDSKNVTALDSDGKTVTLKVNTTGKTIMDYDSDFDITFNLEEEIGTAIIKLENAFKRIELLDVPIALTEIMSEDLAKDLAKNKAPKEEKKSDPVTPDPVVQETTTAVSIPKLCPEFVNTSASGSVKVILVSEVGCFKVHTTGKEINSEFTSSLTFKSDPGFFNAKIYMDNGTVIEKKLPIGTDVSIAYFVVQEKKGKYSVKFSAFNSQPIGEKVELTETTFGADEITCRDKMILWDRSDYLQNITVVGMTTKHVRYVDCNNPQKVLEIHKKEISAVEYANGTEDVISNVQHPYKGHNVTRSRDDMYQKHLK